jgi:spore maturation protein CgeB
MALKADCRFSAFRVGEKRVPCSEIIINVEPYENIIAYPGKKSCLWEIDNHIQQGRKIDNYNKVDYVFITQKYYQSLYPEKKTHWLPLAADPEKHRLYPEEPIMYDVGFLGNDTYPRRKDLLDKIGAKYKLLRSTSKPGEEYSRMLSRCKILFNCSMENDINMRVFESISIGRLLLTDKVPHQDELLKDGEHYVSFNEWEDLDQKISYYLSHEKEREDIAKTGAEYVHAVHTYKERLETILEVMGVY